MSIFSTQERMAKRRKTNHESNDELSNEEHNDRKDERATHSTNDSSSEVHQALKKNAGNFSNTVSNNNNSGKAIQNQTQISNLLSVQTTELLAQVGVDCATRLRSAQSDLDIVIQALKNIPERSAAPLSQAEKDLKKQGISIPFLVDRPRPDIKYVFTFLRIENVRIRGALVSGFAIEGYDSVELAVEMPALLFQEKDFLNHRAFHKRAYYVACIAAGLSGPLKSQFRVRYDLKDGNPLLPILQLTPKSMSRKGTEPAITINVLFDHDLGPLNKTSPSSNCVRPNSNETESPSSSLSPTPFYNGALRWIASITQLDRLMEECSRKCEAFLDACKLGHLWLRQRGFTSTPQSGGFGAEEWATITAYLLTRGGHNGKPLFSDRYTSVQLFKAMLQVLSNRDLIKDPLVFGAHAKKSMMAVNAPLIYDMTDGVNILYKMSLWSYSRLRNSAQASLAAMNSRIHNTFEATFVWKSSDSLLQFDEVYELLATGQVNEMSSVETSFLNELYAVLEQGLGDRVQLVNLGYAGISPWDPSSVYPVKSDQVVQIGLLVNSNVTDRTIDHGPSAEEQDKAKEFRQFWGGKSELRRFRDGSITETLVWSDSSPITQQIIQYLALFHFRIPSENLRSMSTYKKINSLRGSGSISAADGFKIINTKYQDLASRLHQLEGLPLPIRSVSPSDPALRSATVTHPLTLGTARPINVLIQFDSSTRWPDHLPAVQYTKIAFLTKLGDLLSDADTTCSTRLGVEHSEFSVAGFSNTSFLDVILPAPAPGLSVIVFRLRIHHDREVHLLQTKLSSSATSNGLRENLTVASTSFKQDFIASPIHSATLRNLITHFSPLSATIRLLKGWLASHHLTNHFAEPIIEIIATHIFLHPYPWSVPGTSATAFLRCLHFLSHWDWMSSPLIVDLSLTQEMPASGYTELETRFQAWRKLDPAMNNISWFVGTNIDNTGTAWTQKSRPSRVAASRVHALAKASIDYLGSRDEASRADDLNNLFESGTKDFDFVIFLKPSIIRGGKSSRNSNGETQYRNLVIQEGINVDRVGHDVVQLFLQDLERLFDTSLLFFHGEGGNVIAALWRPTTTGVKEWRVRLGYSSVPVAEVETDGAERSDMCEINKDGIIAEIANLGQGIIDRIEVKK